MKKVPRPKFYALRKDFSDGKVRPYDVLDVVFDDILTERGTIRKKSFYIFDDDLKLIPVKTKEQFAKFIKNTLRYYFWGKCECEFIAIDWPYRDTIDNSRPVKIDIYEQLEPNLSIITDLAWEYIEPKVNKLK